MFAYLRSFIEAKKEVQRLNHDYAELRDLLWNTQQENAALTALKHQTTLEELQDTPEDMETLQGASAEYRIALYRFLTARAYRLNEDVLRKASLAVRNDLMTNTKSNKNTIPFDREVKPRKPSDFLPSLFKDDPLP